MQLRAVILLLGLLLLTFGLQPASMQTRVPVPPSLAAQLEAGGQRQIIVGVRTTFVPEGFLAGPAAVDDQRNAIQTALDLVMAQAAAAGVVVGSRFDYIPYFTATVDKVALEALAATPSVTSIEEVRLDSPTLAQSVPLVGAPTAWAAGATGAGWKVAILDTGVAKTHPFLNGKVTDEACFSRAIDLNMGASTASVCPAGVPTSTATGSGVACTGVSGCDHGTHVAGIAAGASGSAAAPNGVAPGAGIIAIQVFTRFNSSPYCSDLVTPCVLASTPDQIDALNHVFTLAGPNNANHVAAVNMSLGGSVYGVACDTVASAQTAAINNLRSIGIATVISAGNNGNAGGISIPACISSAISVGSTTMGDLVSSFSNRVSFLSLMAPGSSITSSVPAGAYASFNGTSMAAPHVAGAWAVIKQAVPAVTVTQVLAALRGTGTPILDSPGSGLTFPRINVNTARVALLTGGAPGAPGTPVASGAGNTVNISWAAPALGGAATGYTVLVRLSPAGAVVASLPVGNQLSATTAAPNGIYYVTVRASNLGWPGPQSASTTVSVPLLSPPPGAPRSLSAAVAGNSATFTWLAPASGGAVQAYTILAAASPGGAPFVSLNAGPATSVPVGGIPPDIYYVRVVASNIGGVGPASNEVLVNVAGPQLPGAPTLNAASVAGATVTLSWAPGAGGTPTSYVVTAALNAVGPGPASNQITVLVP